MENSPINLLADNESKESINLGLPEKTIVPQDLNFDSSDTETGSAFKSIFFDKEIRVWIGIFAAVVVIFGLIFYFINKQSSDIETKIAKIENNTSSTQRELPSYFSANILNPNNDEAPNSTTQNSSTTSQNSTATDDPLAGLNLDGLDFTDDEQANVDEVIIEPSIDTSGTQTSDTSFLDQIQEIPVNNSNNDNLLGSANLDNDGVGIGLDSNTAGEVLMSGELEGDTGPAIWFALIPPALYGLFRKRK